MTAVTNLAEIVVGGTNAVSSAASDIPPNNLDQINFAALAPAAFDGDGTSAVVDGGQSTIDLTASDQTVTTPYNGTVDVASGVSTVVINGSYETINAIGLGRWRHRPLHRRPRGVGDFQKPRLTVDAGRDCLCRCKMTAKVKRDESYKRAERKIEPRKAADNEFYSGLRYRYIPGNTVYIARDRR